LMTRRAICGRQYYAGVTPPPKLSIAEAARKKDGPGVAPPRRMALARLRELLHAAPFPLPPADADSFQKAGGLLRTSTPPTFNLLLLRRASV